MTAIDWEGLRVRALELTRRAYAPYSRFAVGAAALVDDGRTVVGCNVENAAYGVALCAECGLVSDLMAGGGGRLVALACRDAGNHPLMPCGRCLQLLWEHGGPSLLVDTPTGVLAMTAVLPQAFGAHNLAAMSSRADPGGHATPNPDHRGDPGEQSSPDEKGNANG